MGKTGFPLWKVGDYVAVEAGISITPNLNFIISNMHRVYIIVKHMGLYVMHTPNHAYTHTSPDLLLFRVYALLVLADTSSAVRLACSPEISALFL